MEALPPWLASEVLASMTEGVVLQGTDGQVHWSNPAAQRILGLELDQLLGRVPFDERWHAVGADGRRLEDHDFPAIVTLRTRQACTGVVLGVHHPSGERRWLLVNTTPVDLDDGPGVVSTFTDVTEERSARLARAETEVLLTDVFEAAPLAMSVSELRDDGFAPSFWRVNRAFTQLLGHRSADLAGRGVSAVIHPDDRAAVDEARQRLVRGELEHHATEVRLRHRDGSYRWCLLRRSLVRSPDGTPRFVMAQIEDRTEVRAHNQELERLAHTDPLTTLANRRVLERALVERVEAGLPFIVAIADLDGFKAVNDGLGHAAGDEVLRCLADRLRSAFRPGDVVVRLGGDEFAVVVDRSEEVEDAIVERVTEALTLPVPELGPAFRVTVSVGVAGSRAGEPVAELLARADQAMYEAKDYGRGRSQAVS